MKCFSLTSQNIKISGTIIWMSLDFIDDQSTLVWVMAWCRQATSHYLSQSWPRSLSPYGVTRPQWVNSLWPSDTIWRQRSEQTGKAPHSSSIWGARGVYCDFFLSCNNVLMSLVCKKKKTYQICTQMEISSHGQYFWHQNDKIFVSV